MVLPTTASLSLEDCLFPRQLPFYQIIRMSLQQKKTQNIWPLSGSKLIPIPHTPKDTPDIKKMGSTWIIRGFLQLDKSQSSSKTYEACCLHKEKAHMATRDTRFLQYYKYLLYIPKTFSPSTLPKPSSRSQASLLTATCSSSL